MKQASHTSRTIPIILAIAMYLTAIGWMIIIDTFVIDPMTQALSTLHAFALYSPAFFLIAFGSYFLLSKPKD